LLTLSIGVEHKKRAKNLTPLSYGSSILWIFDFPLSLSKERGSPCPSVLRPQGRRKGIHPEGDKRGEVIGEDQKKRKSPPNGELFLFYLYICPFLSNLTLLLFWIA
jgi:hypothetical protein